MYLEEHIFENRRSLFARPGRGDVMTRLYKNNDIIPLNK